MSEYPYVDNLSNFFLSVIETLRPGMFQTSIHCLTYSSIRFDADLSSLAITDSRLDASAMLPGFEHVDINIAHPEFSGGARMVQPRPHFSGNYLIVQADGGRGRRDAHG